MKLFFARKVTTIETINLAHISLGKKVKRFMPACWISYKDKQILHVSFRGMTKSEDLLATVKEAERMAVSSATPVLMLNDLRETSVSAEFMSHIKESNSVMQPHIGRIALLGITGLKRILLDGYMRVAGGQLGNSIKVCQTEEEAKEYLVR